MQCASCHFENMPTLERCVRCGAFLGDALAGMDVYPPRAGQLRKRLREWLPWRRRYYALRDRMPDWHLSGILRGILPSAVINDLTPGIVLRMIVPGWAQTYLGQPQRGAIFAAMYFPMLLLGILMLGTTAGAIALGIAFALHAASVIDLIVSDADEINMRLIVTPFVALVAIGALYGAVGAFAGRYVLPRRLVETAAPFSAGDVVIVNPHAYAASRPQPGDVVLYRVPNGEQRYRMNLGPGPATVYRIVGERIDRIVAGPGSTVRWSDNTLLVNGQPSPWRPLNPQKLPAELNFTVPDGHYGILLSTDTILSAAVPAVVWGSVAVVPRENIVGRAVVRTQPFTQWWWID